MIKRIYQILRKKRRSYSYKKKVKLKPKKYTLKKVVVKSATSATLAAIFAILNRQEIL
jgi:hypothetical protein